MRLSLRFGMMIVVLMALFMLTSVQQAQAVYVIEASDWANYSVVVIEPECCQTLDSMLTSASQTDWQSVILRWVQILAMFALTLPIIYAVVKGQPDNDHKPQRPFPIPRLKD